MQGRRAGARRAGDGAGGAAKGRAGAGRGRGRAGGLGAGVPRGAGGGVHPRRQDQLGRRVGAARRDADQLLRATGGRFGLGDRRRQAGDLHRAARGGRDHAARRRGRLRLLGDPAARRAGEGDRQRGVGADQLHARLRPVLRHGGERRSPARRADGGAALRPSGRHGVRRRQAAGGAAQQLQHLGRGDRRADGGGRGRRRLRAGAQGRARDGAGRGRRAPARRRALGLCDDPGARALARDHAQHLRGGRAGGAVPRPDQRREQPALLRADRGDQPLRRDPDPRPRLLLPRVDRPDAIRARRRSGPRHASTWSGSPRWSRSRCGCSTTC